VKRGRCRKEERMEVKGTKNSWWRKRKLEQEGLSRSIFGQNGRER
jgi:hypothetical protein